MITVEEYAELCAVIAGGADENEIAVAARFDVTASEWAEAKRHYTTTMADPLDATRTALAFIVAYQSARSRQEPCSLEVYTRVLAELAHQEGRRGRGFSDTLEAHGFTRATWRTAEQYWAPRIAADDNPAFSPGDATRFRVLMAQATGKNEIAREVDFARRRLGRALRQNL